MTQPIPEPPITTGSGSSSARTASTGSRRTAARTTGRSRRCSKRYRTCSTATSPPPTSPARQSRRRRPRSGSRTGPTPIPDFPPRRTGRGRRSIDLPDTIVNVAETTRRIDAGRSYIGRILSGRHMSAMREYIRENVFGRCGQAVSRLSASGLIPRPEVPTSEREVREWWLVWPTSPRNCARSAAPFSSSASCTCGDARRPARRSRTTRSCWPRSGRRRHGARRRASRESRERLAGIVDGVGGRALPGSRRVHGLANARLGLGVIVLTGIKRRSALAGTIASMRAVPT